mgnify:FL=1
MKEEILNDIRDDEIRIIGEDAEKKRLLQEEALRELRENEERVLYRRVPEALCDDDTTSKKSRRWLWLIVPALALIGLAAYLLWPRPSEVGEPERELVEATYTAPLSHDAVPAEAAYTEIRDTTVNDIELRLFFPHGAKASLSVGAPDKTDASIILIAQAADVRGDNGEMAGSFVQQGEVLAKGSTKQGFCAILDGKITLGVDKNSSLFEKAIEEDGYFFRQYSLVNHGVMEESNPKRKSIRRALCQRGTEVFMLESQSRESFHDFSQALADIGMDTAIYLVGANAYGWAVDKDGTRHEFGDENRSGIDTYGNINYIVWR